MLTTGNNNRHANIVKRFFICQHTAPIKRKSPRRAGIFIPRTSASGALQNPGFPCKTKTVRSPGQYCHGLVISSCPTCRFGEVSEWRSLKQLCSKLGTAPRVIGGCPKSLRAMQLERLAPQRPGAAPMRGQSRFCCHLPLKRASFGRPPPGRRSDQSVKQAGLKLFLVRLKKRTTTLLQQIARPRLPQGHPPPAPRSPVVPSKPKGTNLLQGPIFNHDKIIAIDF